jgi:hypothetical protein
MKKNTTIIGFNQSEFDRFKQIETDLFNFKDDLLELSDHAVGADKITDLKKYLQDPINFLVDLYRTLYITNKPDTADFKGIFQTETRIPLSKVKEIKDLFDARMKALGRHAPIINGKEIISTLKKDSFNIYLDETKREHYETLNLYVDSYKKLATLTNVGGSIHCIRAVGSLQMDGIGVKININDFKE